MNCEELDLKAYALGEASAAERKTIEKHAVACEACRTELDSLGTLHVALRTWADEEPPRRIAFVSDKVFEPTLWQRWFATLNPANLLASAALAGLVSFGVARLGSAPSMAVNQPSTIPVANTSNAVDLKSQIDNAVKLALAESEARHQQETAQLLTATERRIRKESAEAAQQTLAVMEANFEYMRKRDGARILRASADTVNLQ